MRLWKRAPMMHCALGAIALAVQIALELVPEAGALVSRIVAPLMVQKVFETVLAISREGVTILLIEQNAKLALEVSHRGYVMESGEITLAGDAKALLHDPKIRAAYLGVGA